MKQSFLSLILFTLFSAPCLAQTKEAIEFDVFNQAYFADAIARMDAVASTLVNDPNLTAYIIVAGDEKYAGRTHRYENRLRNYLINHRRMEAKRVVAISGDCKQAQHTEIWLVPDGAKPPVIKCVSSLMSIPANQVTNSDVEVENLELKRRLREVETERDILKKAALIFGRGS